MGLLVFLFVFFFLQVVCSYRTMQNTMARSFHLLTVKKVIFDQYEFGQMKGYQSQLQPYAKQKKMEQYSIDLTCRLMTLIQVQVARGSSLSRAAPLLSLRNLSLHKYFLFFLTLMVVVFHQQQLLLYLKLSPGLGSHLSLQTMLLL